MKSTFNIKNFKERLEVINQFDGNLRYGAGEFHSKTNRTGKGRPSSGGMVREHARVVRDTGVERYERLDGLWEPVDKCNVCGESERSLFVYRFGLEIFKCHNCSHKYLSPRVKEDDASRLYGDDKTASDIYTQPMQIEIDEIKYQYGLDLVAQLDPPDQKKVMDIGCGAGTMLKMAYKNNWKHCVGVDLNERYSDTYQEIEGVQFVQANFYSLDPEKLGNDYDCISMWSVLEHLYHLDEVLVRIKLLLKKNGLLFILVPNADSLATRLIRSMSPTFNWKHLSHFSPESLKFFMEKHGFKTVHFETVITEIDNIKSYLSGEYPYNGHGDPKGLFDFITPEYIHSNLLGSRLIGVFRNSGDS